MLDLFAFDQSILSAFTSPDLSAVKPFFFALTELGSPTALLIYAAIGIALGNKNIKKIAAVLAIGLLLSAIVTEDVKDLVQRQRPYAGIAPVYLYTNEYSFPSGHAVATFLTATIILAFLGWKWGLAGYLIAVLVGISRVVLNVHYPSDVIAGAALGIMLGALVMFAAHRLGLYDGHIPISRLIKEKKTVKNDTGMIKKSTSVSQAYLITIAILLGIISLLLSLGYLSFGLAAMALAAFVIIYSMSMISKERVSWIHVISIILVGTISSYATLMLGGYIISLAVALITYIAILLLSIRNADNFRPKFTE